MEGNGVVDAGADALGGECAAESRAAAGADDIEVVDALCGALNQGDPGAIAEEFVIEGGDAGAGGVPAGEAFEEGAEVAGLDFVEAGVDPGGVGDHSAGESAAIAGETEAGGGAGGADRDSAAIAEGAQVFRGVETVGDEVGPGGQRPSAKTGAMGLGGVLEEGEAECLEAV